MRAFLLVLILVFTTQCSWFRHKSETCENTFTVAALSFWPISFRDEQGNWRGMAYDTVNELRKRTGCQFNIERQVAFDSWKALFQGQADITMFNFMGSSERPAESEFVTTFKVKRILVVNRKVFQKDWTIQQYIDAPKIRFSGVIGMKFAFLEGEIQTLREQHLYIETTDHENLLLLVANGKADATFFTRAGFDYYGKKNAVTKQLIKIPDEQNQLNAGMNLSKKSLNQENRDLIKKVINEMVSDGSFEGFYKKYQAEINNKMDNP